MLQSACVHVYIFNRFKPFLSFFIFFLSVSSLSYCALQVSSFCFVSSAIFFTQSFLLRSFILSWEHKNLHKSVTWSVISYTTGRHWDCVYRSMTSIQQLLCSHTAIIIIRWRALNGARVDASLDCVVEGRDQSYQAIFILTNLSGAVSLLGDAWWPLGGHVNDPVIDWLGQRGRLDVMREVTGGWHVLGLAVSLVTCTACGIRSMWCRHHWSNASIRRLEVVALHYVSVAYR